MKNTSTANEISNWFFEKTNRYHEPLADWLKSRERRQKVMKWRKKGDVTRAESSEIKGRIL